MALVARSDAARTTADVRRHSSKGRLSSTHAVDPEFLSAAVLTGAPESLLGVAIALKSEGFDILAAEWEADAIGAGIQARSVDWYVQFPPAVSAGSGTPLQRAATILAEEMVARCDAMTKVGPLLAPEAAVMLVVGDHFKEPSGCGSSLRDFVEIFAEAIRGDRRDVRVLIADESSGAAAIASAARRHVTPPTQWRAALDIEPEMGFTDWRDEVLARFV
jgi:hypothetical protein